MAPRKPLVNRRAGTNASSSATELCNLIHKELGLTIKEEEILHLFNVKFHLISELAHEIHQGIAADPKLELELTKLARSGYYGKRK